MAGVTVKQLRAWAERGFVQPHRHPAWGWPAAEVDRAEILGVLGRRLGQSDLFLSLAEAIEDGTFLVLPDGDYEVVVSWRRRHVD